MKKLLLIIVFLVIIFSFFAIRDGSGTPQLQNEETVSDGTFRPDPANATFTFDNRSITLSQGRYETSIAPDSIFKEEIYTTDFTAYGDLNNDKKNDTAIILVQASGASGVFIHLASYVSGPINYKGSNAVFLGDRVTPRTLKINNGIITVEYLDRKPDEPFAAEPTIPVTRHFEYKSGTLIEVN